MPCLCTQFCLSKGGQCADDENASVHWLLEDVRGSTTGAVAQNTPFPFPLGFLGVRGRVGLLGVMRCACSRVRPGGGQKLDNNAKSIPTYEHCNPLARTDRTNQVTANVAGASCFAELGRVSLVHALVPVHSVIAMLANGPTDRALSVRTPN